jgi:TolB protein
VAQIEAMHRNLTAAGQAAPGRFRRIEWILVGILAAIGLFFLVRIPSGDKSPSPPAVKLSQITLAEGVEDFPAWSPDSRRLAYAVEAGGIRHLYVKDIDSGKEDALTRGDFDEIQPAFTPDGRTLVYVRAIQAGKRLEPGDVFGQYTAADVWARDLASGREWKVVENAFNPAPSPDGAWIAVDAAWIGPSRIWLVDRQGHNPVQLTSDTSEAVVHLRPRWSADGSKIVFQNQERTKFDVRVADVASKKISWVTDDLFQDIAPVFAPSGRYIFFSSYRSGGLNLWRIPVKPDGTPSGRAEQLTNGAGQDVNPAVSRDGRRIAFSILRQNATIWRLPVSPETGHPAGPPQEMIATTREESRGAWSPAGDRIAFNSDRTGDMNIWVYALRDASVRQITLGPGGDFQPEWSPDGNRLVFFSSRTGNADVWDVGVASGEMRRLTRSHAMEINPFYSPDGRHIAYQSDESGRLEVWVMDASGGSRRQLTSVGATGHFLRWTRDGASVVFRCPCGGKPQTLRVPIGGGEPESLPEVAGGSHISFSPDITRVMDVVGHKALWVSPLFGSPPEKVFEFDDPAVRIDYPVWSPDGRWVLFDRFSPHGGDIWMLEGF